MQNYLCVHCKYVKNVLDFLIHDNQKGFLKDRYIGEKTRIIYDVLQSAKEKNIPGMLLLIDFEKAFDSVSWRFMYKTLNFSILIQMSSDGSLFYIKMLTFV